MLLQSGGRILWPLLAAILLAITTTSSRAQTSSCVQSNGVSCVTCGPRILVDSSSGNDCSGSLDNQRSLANRTCSSLEVVLRNIEGGWTSQGGADNCIEVVVSQGDYVVSRSIHISQSVVLRGVVTGEGGEGGEGRRRRRQADPRPPQTRQPGDPAPDDSGGCPQGMPRVTFDVPLVPEFAPDGSQLAVYILTFSNTALVGVAGLEFAGAPGLIGLDNVTMVTVENSSFNGFAQGAFDTYNCDQVFVRGSCFRDNGPVFVTKPQGFRAQSAGLSISYISATITNFTLPPTVVVTGSSFSDNQAVSDISFVLQTGNLPALSGAALSLRILSDVAVDFTVEDCEFLRNEASLSGGAVYLVIAGSAMHRVFVNASRFDRNTSPRSAGAMAVSLLNSQEDQTVFSQVLISHCSFERNQARYGGAVYILPLFSFFKTPIALNQASVHGHTVTFNLCSFHKNTAQEVGGALATSSITIFSNREDSVPLSILDCVFTENTASNGGVMSTSFLPLRLSGANHFINNRGASLVVDGARVVVSGLLNFTDNTNIGVLGGGVLYFGSQGQVELVPNTHILFVNNKGVVGSAVTIDTLKVPRIFSQLFANPLCSFIFSDPRVSPLNWADYNVTLTFIENRAVIAAAVLLENVDLCSWAKSSPPFFERENVFLWPNTIQLSDNMNMAHSNSTDPRWAVQSRAVRLEIPQKMVTAFPGEMIQVGLFAFDELGLPVVSDSFLSDDSQTSFLNTSKQIEYFKFLPPTVSVQTVSAQNATRLMFATLDLVPPNQIETINVESLLTDNIGRTSFNISSRRCPPGRGLVPVTEGSPYSTCQCNFNNPSIINCLPRRVTFIEDHLWATEDRDVMGDPLITHPCPGGYCRCFVISLTGPQTCAFAFSDSSPDQQCICDREGILCGSCMNGTGFSALRNKCVSCADSHGLLILGLVTFNIIFFVLLFTILLQFPLPSWTYPCLFYLQILPRFVEHFPVTFENFGVYMVYVGSAFELYFPYDFCLGSEVSALVVYAVRYVPALVAAVVAPVMLLLRLYIAKLRPVPWHGSWTAVLLVFTPVLHTSATILTCPSLPRGTMDDFENKFRWYINGNIPCFAGRHIPLALLAIVALIGCVLVVIPCSIPLALGKVPERPQWLHHYTEPLTNAYKERYKWWSAVELFRRVAIVVMIVAFPNDNYPSIVVLAAILMAYGLFQPYKSIWTNILDVLLGSEILILLLMRNTSYFEDDLQVIPPQPESLELQRNGRVQCGDIEGHTTFASVLAAFYYVPLLLSLVALLVWTGYVLYSAVRTKGMPMYQNYMASKKQPSVHAIVPKGQSIKRRDRTQTVVELSELDSPPPTPIEVKNKVNEASFATSFHGLNAHRERTTTFGDDERQRQPTISEVSMQQLEELDRAGEIEKKRSSKRGSLFKLKRKKVGRAVSLPVKTEGVPCCPKEPQRGKLQHSQSEEKPSTGVAGREDSIARVLLEERSAGDDKSQSVQEDCDTPPQQNDSNESYSLV